MNDEQIRLKRILLKQPCINPLKSFNEFAQMQNLYKIQGYSSYVQYEPFLFDWFQTIATQEDFKFYFCWFEFMRMIHLFIHIQRFDLIHSMKYILQQQYSNYIPHNLHITTLHCNFAPDNHLFWLNHCKPFNINCVFQMGFIQKSIKSQFNASFKGLYKFQEIDEVQYKYIQNQIELSYEETQVIINLQKHYIISTLKTISGCLCKLEFDKFLGFKSEKFKLKLKMDRNFN
ncbi:unnamed protein product [Paramecium octaurelia]|uniref:Uncharacterized protein n=1 Tax=Paramecium octaurelia TaxID=43137 RepID=A0A8S1YIG1_PAROT|nr:unnamed protein product [Paramecium octaurelia]